MQLVGFMVEADDKGVLKPTLIKVDVRETDKMYKIQENLPHNSSKAFGYKSNIRKEECGRVFEEKYTNSFRFWCYDCLGSNQQIEDLMKKVQDKVQLEILHRMRAVGRWQESYIEMMGSL